jgi:Zn-dependent peptidase ImmA (M78 family)
MEISKTRICYCRDMARKVLRETNSLRAPVPVHDIAKHYGFKVVQLDQPPDKFSGILHKEKKAIGINKHNHFVRQRFSLAHELGHYFLDHPAADDILPHELETDEKKIYESEANEFAAELLVPRELLKEALQHDHDVEFLREHFQVSRHVIVIQITKHGFLMKI